MFTIVSEVIIAKRFKKHSPEIRGIPAFRDSVDLRGEATNEKIRNMK